MYIGLHIKCVVFVRFLSKLNVLTNFSKSPKCEMSRIYLWWKSHCSVWGDEQI